MPDASYQPKVYEEQGGNALVVQSGGSIELPVTTQATTSGTITNFGITTIGTTIASGYTLADPDRAGLRKTILCTVHGASTVAQVVTCASANALQNIVGGSTVGAGLRVMTFSEPSVVELVSLSTSVWAVLQATPSVAITS